MKKTIMYDGIYETEIEKNEINKEDLIKMLEGNEEKYYLLSKWGWANNGEETMSEIVFTNGTTTYKTNIIQKNSVIADYVDPLPKADENGNVEVLVLGYYNNFNQLRYEGEENE